MKCVNLKERFGRRFKIRYDESYQAENPKFRSEEEPWLQVIPCIGGEIYPHGGDTLAGFLRRGSRAEQLKRLGCVRVKTEGSDGVTVLFQVVDFDEVAAIMRPRKRRYADATPEQLAALRERARHARRFLIQSRPEPQESTIGA